MTMAKELAYYEVSPEDARTVTEEVESNVRNAAYEIIRCKGSTHYAVSVCVARIVEAVLLNQQSILTVSTMLEGEYGIHDVCLSTPCVVGREGVLYRAEAALNEEETAGLRRSAERLRETIAQIM
jgi:L-lactate dehydrogenase